jgi:hypothetical protein
MIFFGNRPQNLTLAPVLWQQIKFKKCVMFILKLIKTVDEIRKLKGRSTKNF